MTNREPTDSAARHAAIDPTRSFIVQAPAGSGKTSLLTQRVLTLLATVEQPDHIVAITFTRKAAAEMRARIIDALQSAHKQNTPPNNAFDKTTWTLARRALTQDKEHNWSLLENPNRLRITTIDAFITSLNQRMPSLAGHAPTVTVTDSPETHYATAIEALFQQAKRDPGAYEAIKVLLQHCDNSATRLALLFESLLKKRDQWLMHLMPHHQSPNTLKKQLENSLSAIADDHIQACINTAPTAHIAIFQYALNKTGCPITEWTLTDWQHIAATLLTKKLIPRASITKKQGFPTDKPIEKAAMMACLESLADLPDFIAALAEVTLTPPPHYPTQQWHALEALLVTLPMLVGILDITLRDNGVIDFIALNFGAHRALGTLDEPTDLTLYLEHRITHLLIDEFQDTSLLQYHLIEKLMAGWQAGDGHSIFCVGDPMQSIYRFRNAEVGLFLKTWQSGIQGYPLETLSLTDNFRSRPGIVDWVNTTFSALFPKTANITMGAVPHHHANAYHQGNKEACIYSSLYIPADTRSNEAIGVVQTIQRIQASNPSASIAILVRARSHLAGILPALKRHHIAFSAIDLDPLIDDAAVIDCLTLTRALIHFADRTAWLSLLRSPVIGLTLADLLVITNASPKGSIWQVLTKANTLSLSDDAKKRIDFLVATLNQANQRYGRTPCAEWIESIWHALRYPQINSRTANQHAAQFFSALRDCNSFSRGELLPALNRQLKKLYAQQTTVDASVQIMTIHKSKGLEFDHVLLPALDKKPSIVDTPLLHWLELPHSHRDDDLLLSPLKSTEAEADPIVSYCRHIDRIKSDEEFRRLLYVATTRAKQSLHLFAEVNTRKGTALALLADHFDGEVTDTSPTDSSLPEDRNYFNRLPSSFFIDTPATSTTPIIAPQYTPNLKTHEATIGTIIHRALEIMSLTQTAPTPDSIKAWCLTAGVPCSACDKIIEMTLKAINNTKNDPKGQWILDNHPEAESEWHITYFDHQGAHSLIIDRTFVYNERRWIIDYKTGQSEEANSHRPQLNTYAHALSKNNTLPISCGIYYPLTSRWIEWEYEYE